MFQLGISTASLFLRKNTEDALALLPSLGSECSEVFMGTLSEYLPQFGDVLRAKQGEQEVHSIHSLNQNYEPELFNDHPRTRGDAEAVLRMVLGNGQKMGAKYYTFHGPARLKRKPYIMNWPVFGPKVAHVAEICAEYGITLCYENVHWAYYNYPTFHREMKEYAPGVMTTLDIKQAMQSGVDVYDYIEDMGEDIRTVHVVDHDKDGKLCLPGKGVFDFRALFEKLRSIGFEGAVLIEAYYGDYDRVEELAESLAYLKEIRADVYRTA